LEAAVADEKLEVEVRANINGLDRDMAAAARSVKGLGDASDVAAKKAEAHARKMEELKHASTEVGKGMMVAGLAIGAGVAVAVVEFAKYDKALAGYRAVSQATRAETDLLTKQAMKLGETYGYTSVEVVNAATALNKAGVSTKDVLGGALSGALTLAASDTMDVAEAADIAAIAMTQFGLHGKDVPHIADLLAAGAANAVGDVKDLAWGLRQTGLVADQFGLDLDETVGALAGFAAAGLLGSDAGTSMKQMLLSLAAPSGVAKKKMDELGLSAYDAKGDFIGIEGLAGELQRTMGGLSQESRNAALSIIFGQDAIRTSTELYNLGAAGVEEWANKVNQAGFAQKVAAEKMNNLSGDWKKLTVSIQNGLIDMGSSADGFLRPIVQAVTGAVQSFRDLPEPVKGGILAVAGLTSGALLLAGAVMTTVPKIVEFKESWDKLTAAGGKHAVAMSKVITAVSGVTAAYAAASVGIRMMTDAINANDKKVNSSEVINRFAGASTAPNKIAPALDETFRGITTTGNADFTAVNDYSSALKRIYQPTISDSRNDFFSDAMMNQEAGGGYRAREAFKGLDKGLTDLASSGATSDATATFAEMQKRAEGLGISVGDLIKLVPNYRDQMVSLATQNGLTNLTEEEKAKVLSGTSSKLAGAIAATKTAALSQEQAVVETEKWSEALAEIGVNIDGTIASLSTFTEYLVQAGLLTLSSRDATASFEAALDGMDQKIKDIMVTEQQLGGVLNETRTDFDLTTEAGRAGNDVFADLATKGIASAVAMAKAGEGQEAIQGRLSDTYDAMVKAGIGFGLTEEASVALTREVLKVPAGVSIDSWMAEKARIEAEKTKAAMDLIDGRVVKTYTENMVANITRQITTSEYKDDPSMVAFDPGTFAPGKAMGGAIGGAGPKGVDNDLYRLARGEHVWTADDVDAAGGQAAVYAMRAAVRSGAAYRAPAGSAASSNTGAGNLPPIYIMSPFDGQYVLAQMDTRAAAAIQRADQQTVYARAGR
jgi:TP901 family phage tail tape measure protein